MAGYTRQSTFTDGDTITAALFNNEFESKTSISKRWCLGYFILFAMFQLLMIRIVNMYGESRGVKLKGKKYKLSHCLILRW